MGFTSEMDGSQGCLIMKNGATVIGLFQGMLMKNSLTFNPGWDQDVQELASFTDVRELRGQLEAAGLEIGEGNTTESGSRPAFFTLVYQDGNPILIDQHL